MKFLTFLSLFVPLFSASAWSDPTAPGTESMSPPVPAISTASGLAPVPAQAPGATAATPAPEYDSREALPIAPRRYDSSDELSKTIFSSVSGNDPNEGLGMDAKAEAKPSTAPTQAKTTAPAVAPPAKTAANAPLTGAKPGVPMAAAKATSSPVSSSHPATVAAAKPVVKSVKPSSAKSTVTVVKRPLNRAQRLILQAQQKAKARAMLARVHRGSGQHQLSDELPAKQRVPASRDSNE